MLSLTELQSRSLDVDFIDEEQLKKLLQPPKEQIAEPVESVVAEEPEASIEEPVIQEEQEEPAPEQTAIPEDELFEPPSQETIQSNDLVEVETIESAVPVERISREEVRKNFSSLVSNLKLDLSNRSQSVKTKSQTREKERAAAGRAKKVQTIVSSNEKLFDQKKIAAKWKQFPMSRMMRMEYQPKVDEVIHARWKLPYEMDPSLEARVRVIILKSGKILDYEIVESSSNRFFNHTVLQVFKNLDQLPPLPEDFSGESTEIGLRFTSKQFQNE